MDENLMLFEETISNKIYFIRNQKVMLDKDLAGLFDVETKRINEQVRRNSLKFPEHFMFQLNENEYENEYEYDNSDNIEAKTNKNNSRKINNNEYVNEQEEYKRRVTTGSRIVVTQKSKIQQHKNYNPHFPRHVIRHYRHWDCIL